MHEPTLIPYFQKKFLDSLRINVRGGTGGRGLQRYGGIGSKCFVSLQTYVLLVIVGPGGRGGHVYAVCDSSTTLKRLRENDLQMRFVGGVGGDSKCE